MHSKHESISEFFNWEKLYEMRTKEVWAWLYKLEFHLRFHPVLSFAWFFFPFPLSLLKINLETTRNSISKWSFDSEAAPSPFLPRAELKYFYQGFVVVTSQHLTQRF